MHDVQTLSRFGLPATMARTRWMFGSQRRLVFFFDQGTLWPNPGLLPHTSHTAATGARSQITSKPVSCPMWATGKEYPTSASAANLEVGQRYCPCRRLASSDASMSSSDLSGSHSGGCRRHPPPPPGPWICDVWSPAWPSAWSSPVMDSSSPPPPTLFERMSEQCDADSKHEDAFQ